jgi:outer membrane protein assembly factor BamC
MQVRNIVLGFAAVSLLAGCSVFDRKQVDYKAGAIQTRPLEVPPDLTVPESEQRYTIPGTDGAKVASYSEYTRKTAEQPCVAPASAPAAPVAAAAPAARLKESNGAKSILLGEPFDRSWRKIGLALERARIAATDKDRSKGIYFIAAAPDKDKKKRPDLQVVVRENAGNSEVTVVDADGKSNAETTRLLETLYQNLEK